MSDREMDAAADQDQRPFGTPDQCRGAGDVRPVGPNTPRRRAQCRRVDHEVLGGKIVLAMADILRDVEQYRARPAGGRHREGAAQQLGHAACQLDPDQFLDRRPQYLGLPAFLRHVLPGMRAVGVAGQRDHRGPGVQCLDQAGDEIGGARPERPVADPGPVGDPSVSLRGKGAAPLVVDQEVPHAELRQRIVKRQKLKPAHAEHWPDAGEPQHLGERAAAVHAAGGSVADPLGIGHACLPRSAAPRRVIATNSRAVIPGARPSAAARVLTRLRIPSS